MHPQIANPLPDTEIFPIFPEPDHEERVAGRWWRGHSSDFSHFSSEAWLRLRPGRKKWRGQLQTGDRPENVNIPPLIFLNPHFDLLIWVQTRLILASTPAGEMSSLQLVWLKTFFLSSPDLQSFYPIYPENLHNRHVYVWIICNL